MRRLFRMARPQFLLAGMALYVWGAAWGALTGGLISLPRLLFGYLVILPAHLSLSFSNDYFDVEADRHGAPTFLSGGSGVLISHPELRQSAKRIAIVLTVSSLVLGAAVWWIHRYPIVFLVFVAVGNLLTWFYAAPPLRLAYHGWGELATALTAGVLLPGMGALAVRGQMDTESLRFIFPLFCVGLAFILAVEVPDWEADRMAKKWTWVAQKGRAFGFLVIGGSLAAASLYLVSLPRAWAGPGEVDLRVLGWFSLVPFAAGAVGAIRRPQARQAAQVMAMVIVLALAVFLILVDGFLITRVAQNVGLGLAR